jgi:hypothetical protein
LGRFVIITLRCRSEASKIPAFEVEEQIRQLFDSDALKSYVIEKVTVLDSVDVES